MVECIGGHWLSILRNIVFLSLKNDFAIANSADTDEMPHYGHFIWVFTVCRNTCLVLCMLGAGFCMLFVICLFLKKFSFTKSSSKNTIRVFF